MANEKRLIWDEDAKRHLIALATGHHTETLHIDMILNAILCHTTTVDAVHAAGACYCGECKHWKKCESSLIGEVMCCTGQGSVYIQKGAGDFCSSGERRERENETYL